MFGLRSRVDPETRDVWRHAVVGAVVSWALIAAVNWGDWSYVDASPLALGCALAGYRYDRGRDEGGRVGHRAGIIAAVPLLYYVPQIVDVFAGALQSGSLAVVPVTFFAFVLAIAVFGVAAVFGQVGGMVGGWLAATQRSQSAQPTH